MSMVPKAAIMAQKARGLLFGFCRSFSILSLLDSMGLYYIAHPGFPQDNPARIDIPFFFE
jgi:hypothetical protein